MKRTILRRVRGGNLESAAPQLPDDFYVIAWRRLGHTAVLYAVVYSAILTLGHVFRGIALMGHFVDVVVLVFVVTSLLFARWAYRAASSASTDVLNAGVFFMVFGAIGIESGGLFAIPDFSLSIAPGLSWVAVWIAIFPIIVPVRLWQAFFAGVFAASLRPALLVYWWFLGAEPPDASLALMLIVPSYVAVAISVASSHEIYRLGREVREARELGAYRLVERIGEGGMGEVWRAQHRLLARPAAVKVIKLDTELLDDSTSHVLGHFEREALATAGLSSPHTVRIYDFGVSDQGAFYYVMEHLRGWDLDSLVRKAGPIEPERAVFLLKQACASIGEAHEAGLVHRDIKPANLFAAHIGNAYDFVKVLDFGLVKVLGEARADEGFVAGTPAFMAPELLTPERPVDGRADIYGLACVAFWMLTGRGVFEYDDPTRVANAHLDEAPPAVSHLAEFDIPPALESLIFDALSKDPDDRPSDVDVFLERLDAITLERSWTGARAREWWTRYAPDVAGTPRIELREERA